MKLKSNRSFSSFLAELVIVIVGILMAISIDAWWQGIGDSRAERVLLADLRTEFETNRSLLATQFVAYDRRVAAAETLQLLGSDATSLPVDSLNALWKWVLRGGTYDPANGVYEAAVAAGDMTLIDDPNLRAALARWPGRVENMQFVEGAVNNLIFEQLIPWMRLQTAFPNNSFAEFGIPDAQHTTDYEFLSNSVVVDNFLREWVSWDRALQMDREMVDDSIDEILAGIERRLAGH